MPIAVRPVPRRVVPLALAGALGLLAGCDQAGGAAAETASAAASDASGQAASTSPPVALPVATEEARDGDLILRVTTTGQVRSDALVPLRAEVPGTVAELRLRPGQQVAAGAVLVTFDAYPFDLAVREAQARADEAEQRFLESFVPESLVTGRGPTPDQRRALMNRAGVTAARLQLERARYELARATVRSSVAGVVQAVEVAVGEKLSAGQALATVVDTRHLRVEAQLLEHDLPLVRVGGEALVTTAGAPGRAVRGRVDALLPLVDSVARAGRAVVRLTGDGVLRPGMYADVKLEATRLPNRRLVPARAVIERDGRPLVFVVRDGRAQWTYIVPGRSNGVDTEVLPDSSSGEIPVKAGDPVIVDGHLTLTHDAPVRVAVPAARSRDRDRAP
ncbi:MAG: efflux RND transporter periplasmic adaptor subunit [Gemmatimonas sp.]|uniref:efflux RND transporter periplasmic adaptor subunit n=1 Tax=Gemmatimonas sp. TaxID=1962908 RepID=UPI00391F6943